MTTASESGRPTPHRMCDLGPWGLVAAATVALLLLAPFAMSAGRSLADGWIPTGDEALLALRAHDVVDGHPPLVGQPSTSHLGGGRATRHPGPIQQWLFAVPVRMFGAAAGMRWGAAAVNGGAIVLAAWVAFRRAGWGFGLTASLVLATIVWAQGTDVSSDPLSSNQGAYPFLGAAFLVWGVAGRDLALAPLAVVVASFAAQQHLNQVIPVAALALLAVGIGGWHVVAGRRRARAAGGRDVTDRAGSLWIAASLALGALSVVPMLVQEVRGDPGNIESLIRYSSEGDRPTLGAGSGAAQVMRALGSPSLLARHDLSGFEAHRAVSWAGTVAGLVVGASLVGLALADARRERGRLAMVALAVAAAGFVNGTNLLEFEGTRINQFRWMWTASGLAWLVIGWWVVDQVRSHLRREPAPVVRRAAPIVAAVTVIGALLAGDVGAFAERSGDDEPRFATAFGLVESLAPPVRTAADAGDGWLVAIDGLLALNAVAPALVLDLAEHGVEVKVQAVGTDAPEFFGEHRRPRPGEVRQVLLVRSSLGPPPPIAPGDVVAVGRLNPELNTIIDGLGRDLLGQEVRVAAPALADAILSQQGLDPLERFVTGVRAQRLGTDPHALRDGRLLRALPEGLVVRPTIESSTVRAMSRLVETGGEPLLWDHDRVEVRVLTPQELADLPGFG